MTVTSRSVEEAAAPPRPAAQVGSGRLGAVAFVAGGGTLATEIGASRLLAPYFGSSTIVWANIIGLILVYLSVGYWLGGRLADRKPRPQVLGRIVLVAAVLIAVIPFVAHPILNVALRGFADVSIGAVLGSFLSALALFSVPVTLLGMVSPFAIRLALSDVEQAGTVAGRLYALSTLGSILGTFLSALVTIELFGTQRTFVGTAVLLALAAVLLSGLRIAPVALSLALLLLVPPATIGRDGTVLSEKESAYQYVSVVRWPDGTRVLELNEGVGYHSMRRPGSVLTGEYWDLFLMLPALLDHPPRSMLVIGNAGGTIARAYGRFYPQVRIDGVEIDPAVTAAGRRFFGMDQNPRLTVHTADGRPYLELSHKRWDLIVVDAYRQPYIPFYLTTREFFQLVRDHLNPGGMVAMNVETTPGDHRLSQAIGTTLLSAFPQAWRWSPLRFSDLLIGLDRPRSRSVLARRAGKVPAAVRPLTPLFRTKLQPVHAQGRPLTDDRAPVEWITDRMLVERIASGKGVDEVPLPTMP